MLWISLLSMCISNPALNLMEFLVLNSCFLGKKKKKNSCLIVHRVKWHFPAPSLHLTDQLPALLLDDRENQVFPSSPCCLMFGKSASCLPNSWVPPWAPWSSWCLPTPPCKHAGTVPAALCSSLCYLPCVAHPVSIASMPTASAP